MIFSDLIIAVFSSCKFITPDVCKTEKCSTPNSLAKPFKFKLGKKEVIGGWDVGLAGESTYAD